MQTSRLAFALFAILIASFALAQPSVSVSSNPSELLHGVIANNTYTNNFLGFSYPIPEGWEVNSDEVIPQHPGEGKAAGEGGGILLVLDRNKHILYRNRILLSVMDAHGSVDTQRLVSKFVDALTKQEGEEIVRASYPVDCAGKTFFREDYKQTSAIFTGYKAFVGTKFRDHLLGWTLVASSPGELDELAGSLGRLSFQEDRPGSTQGINIVGAKISEDLVPKVRQSAPGSALRVRVSEKVSQGLLIKKVQPGYPDRARQEHIQGPVLLKALIDTSGNVRELEVVSGPPLLGAAAMDAVIQWKYKPYVLNGTPMDLETQITVSFTLSGS